MSATLYFGASVEGCAEPFAATLVAFDGFGAGEPALGSGWLELAPEAAASISLAVGIPTLVASGWAAGESVAPLDED
jgi:hypothetical protein